LQKGPFPPAPPAINVKAPSIAKDAVPAWTIKVSNKPDEKVVVSAPLKQGKGEVPKAPPLPFVPPKPPQLDLKLSAPKHAEGAGAATIDMS
jgi:hypothetical protein